MDQLTLVTLRLRYVFTFRKSKVALTLDLSYSVTVHKLLSGVMLPFDHLESIDDAAVTALGLKARPLASELIALEPRMVFDGAAAATVAAVIDATDHGAGSAPDAGGTDTAIDAAQRLAATIEPAAPPAPPASREIVFVDSRVSDRQAFVTAAGDNRLFITINANEDGLAVISRVLSEQQGDISAVHIIGHGREGEALLGSLLVDAGAVEDHADMLQGWRSHLTADADILLYGCDIAAGDTGANLIAVLAEKTGADVAASKDSVGVTEAGADWSLETTTGQIEARVLAPARWTCRRRWSRRPGALIISAGRYGHSYVAMRCKPKTGRATQLRRLTALRAERERSESMSAHRRAMSSSVQARQHS
jgi:hypothetical protein